MIVGIPHIVPLLLPKFNPGGRLGGLISHEVIAPAPISVGSSGRSLLASPLVRTSAFGEYDKVPGAISIIVRFIVVEDEPLALVAVIVYIAGVICKDVGVPLITPLLKVRPLGRVGGEIDHVVGEPMIPFPALLTLNIELLEPL